MTDSTSLLRAVREGNRAEVAQVLAADPSAASVRDERDVPLVLVALYRGHGEVAREVAAAREVDVHEAAALGDAGRVAELVEADPSAARAVASDGFTPLHLAAFFARPEVARVLLAAGADASEPASNPSAVRPLHSAAAQGAGAEAHEVVRLLLEAGADPNAAQAGGWTALHSRALHGDRELAELLVRRGADPRRAADDGRTPIDMARGGGHGELAAFLEAARPPAD